MSNLFSLLSVDGVDGRLQEEPQIRKTQIKKKKGAVVGATGTGIVSTNASGEATTANGSASNGSGNGSAIVSKSGADSKATQKRAHKISADDDWETVKSSSAQKLENSKKDQQNANSSEKPNHNRYIKEFRTQPCNAFQETRFCDHHKPYTCFYWHFRNQRRRRPCRNADGSYSYSAEVSCPDYNDTAGECSNGENCPYLHRNFGDTERRYHPRFYKTSPCNFPTTSAGHCQKNGPHCAFAHGPDDLRQPVFGEPQGIIHEKPPAQAKSTVPSDPRWLEAYFLVANYKTVACDKPGCRLGATCPEFHFEKERRRNPYQHTYNNLPCAVVKSGSEWGDPSDCPKGADCRYCHSRTEMQYHPNVYKSQLCEHGTVTRQCPRTWSCAFAHGDTELLMYQAEAKGYLSQLNNGPGNSDAASGDVGAATAAAATNGRNSTTSQTQKRPVTAPTTASAVAQVAPVAPPIAPVSTNNNGNSNSSNNNNNSIGNSSTACAITPSVPSGTNVGGSRPSCTSGLAIENSAAGTVASPPVDTTSPVFQPFSGPSALGVPPGFIPGMSNMGGVNDSSDWGARIVASSANMGSTSSQSLELQQQLQRMQIQQQQLQKRLAQEQHLLDQHQYGGGDMTTVSGASSGLGGSDDMEQTVLLLEQERLMFRQFRERSLIALTDMRTRLALAERQLETQRANEVGSGMDDDMEGVRMLGIVNGSSDLSNLATPVLLKTQAQLKASFDRIGLLLQDRAQQTSPCVVCQENPRTIALQPCQHMCLCNSCASGIEACPVCNVLSTGFVTIPY